MTRATLTLELLAVLACACERQEDPARRPNDAGIPIESADPEWSNRHLEGELDRIEKEIGAGKVVREAEKPALPAGNKSKNFRNKPPEGAAQRSGSGSS